MNLQYIGQSNKKLQIFRARKWNKNLEKIFKKSVFNERYQLIGTIFDLTGPVKNPFISIKLNSGQKINPSENLYVKL